MSIEKVFAYKVQCDEQVENKNPHPEAQGKVRCAHIVFIFAPHHVGKYGSIEVIEGALKNGFGYNSETHKMTCRECLIRTGQMPKPEKNPSLYGASGERLN